MTGNGPPPTKRPGAVVTGLGIVSSIGRDLPSFSAALAEGRSGIRRLTRVTEPPLAVDIGAEIDGFDFREAVSAIDDLPESLRDTAARTARRAPFAIQTSVVAALQAWAQAGLQNGGVDPERIGMVVAGNNTTRSLQYALDPDFRRAPEYLSPRYAVQYMDTDQLGTVSAALDIRGEGAVVGGASASGNVGAIHGQRLVRSGLVDACLVIGVVADLSPMEIQGFHNIGAMGGKKFRDAPEKACRPFDVGHEGFIYGQAAAAIVIESSDSASARKRGALAEMAGGAVRLHATASPEPDEDGEARAMTAALAQAGLSPEDIDYVNTHGSSSPLGDDVEIRAIERVFGPAFPNVWLNATKGLTGHCLHSAGLVEIVATVVQMRDGFLHPNVNLDAPADARARFCGPTAEPHRIAAALSNSFGFSGINTCVALRAAG